MILIGSDHKGFELKESVKNLINSKDLGCFDKSSCDYPVVVKNMAHHWTSQSVGILICGSGIGMCIAANRFPFMRAVRPCSLDDVRLSKQHNDANVLCFNNTVTTHLILSYLDILISTAFLGLHHTNRIEQLNHLYL